MIAEVRLFGRMIGAVAWRRDEAVADFEYTKEFQSSGIEVAPLTMPLGPRIHSFPELARETFHGLPGLLADALPDKFGNALIDTWLASQGRTPESFDPVERLCYVGTRAMGALEFHPALGPRGTTSRAIDLDALARLAAEILARRDALRGSFARDEAPRALGDLLRVGTSAGGARAKAVIAWNPATGEVRSGQVDAGAGFEHWLLKFDGVGGNREGELDDPTGFGALELAYATMARAAGIRMMECRLLEESGRRHFMTRRFDRTRDGGKLHMQSLGALAHLDYNQAGAHGYEEAQLVVRRLGLGPDAAEELFRRMVFNVVARNQDDHVKNIAFLMDRAGTWSLAPAFDLTYSYNPRGAWTSVHQMTIQGKRDGFTLEDLRASARAALLKRGRADAIVREVTAAVERWPEHAAAAGVAPAWIEEARAHHRLALTAARE